MKFGCLSKTSADIPMYSSRPSRGRVEPLRVEIWRRLRGAPRLAMRCAKGALVRLGLALEPKPGNGWRI
eukprot:6640824-Pyramimonas_sp.AAC.1